MDVAFGPYGQWLGGGCSNRLAWMLASKNELAGSGPGTLVPGVPGLRNQAPFRRAKFSQLWSLQLRLTSTDCVG